MSSILNYIFKIIVILTFTMMCFFSYKYYELLNDNDVVANSRMEKLYSKDYESLHHLTISDVNSAIQEYISQNPEIILKALDQLHKDKLEAKSAQKKDYIKSNKSAIFSSLFPHTNNQGKIDIVFFYDYICTNSSIVDQIITEEIKNHNNINIIYRPLPFLGKNSRYIAEIMLALFKIKPEKFLNMHEKIINSNDLSKEYIMDLLKEYGVEYSDIQNILNTGDIDALLNQNYSIATGLDIKMTPSILINNNVFSGIVNSDTLNKAINEALNIVDPSPNSVNNDNQK